jgi:hypothetical protein
MNGISKEAKVNVDVTINEAYDLASKHNMENIENWVDMKAPLKA